MPLPVLNKLSRWEPLSQPRIVLGLARRILHPKEFANIKRVNLTLFEALLSHGAFKDFDKGSHSAAKLAEKDFTAEAQFFKDRLNTITSGRIRNYLAGRWAAKEAARKAWGAHLLGFKDVRVAFDMPNSPGDPHDRNSNHETAWPGVKIVCEPYYGMYGVNRGAIDAGPRQEGRLSISHDGDYVVATVIAEPLNEQMRNVFKGRASTNLPLGNTVAQFRGVSKNLDRHQEPDEVEPDLESSEHTEESPSGKEHP
ncbi:hypothetical protein LTR70_004474 [Exophiala xenobiotica]|uniref:4'-phosphopantetheinyl transferase domain-containing protein n=1 Tax=Lithohypha guttulata TaxID=1690604 RepID=A0ABR0KDX7_9EURO|nr:hypothetical protein LTR24_003952 [Lithohypha guttulata]KAK5320896.1 hypothetical protein LTR70_004474 [Exophiala xenobiotica]